MPIAAIAPIIGGVLSAGLSAGVAAATRPKGPPELDEGRRRTLGSFAARLAEEDAQAGRQGQEGFVFGPNSRPVRFSPSPVKVDQPMRFNFMP